jgi:hypothetical protein
MLTEKDLPSLGFERLMSDYYRKGDYGLSVAHREKETYFINFQTIIRTLDELKNDYWLNTGDHLE